ncbi:MAG: NfeD family protein [candidate division NC10 bacterium]|nr:NfeD family protein [candidate division NC10 bacterium]
MTTPDPGVRQAVNWIAERMRENADANRLALIDEASQRFGLSPLQTDFYRPTFSTASSFPPPLPPPHPEGCRRRRITRDVVVLAGETWRAENLQPHIVIAPGTAVTVRGTRGLTLLVEGEGATDPEEVRGNVP